MPRVPNPRSGSAFTLAHGDDLELVFELENNNDNLTTFSVRGSGLGSAWSGGSETATGTAGAFGTAQVVLRLRAPEGAGAGEYSFQVSFFERDEPLSSEPDRSFSLTYLGAPAIAEPEPEPVVEIAPEPEPVAIAEPELAVAAAGPPTAAPPITKAPPKPKREQQPAPEPAVVPEPTPTDLSINGADKPALEKKPAAKKRITVEEAPSTPEPLAAHASAPEFVPTEFLPEIEPIIAAPEVTSPSVEDVPEQATLAPAPAPEIPEAEAAPIFEAPKKEEPLPSVPKEPEVAEVKPEPPNEPPLPSYTPSYTPSPPVEAEPPVAIEEPKFVAPSYSPPKTLKPEIEPPQPAPPVAEPAPPVAPQQPQGPSYTPTYTPPTPLQEPEPVSLQETAPRLVDLGGPGTGGTAGFKTQQQALSPVDREVQSPANGTAISAKPGERIRLKFSVKNDASSVSNYEISYDWTHAERWISLEQQIVSLDPDANGWVSCLLEPPLNARAGNYRFHVRYGVLGQPPQNVSLTLSVGAVPSVALSAKQSNVMIGPMGRTIDFALKVQNPSNADTAYRLAAKDPEAQYDRDGNPVGDDNLYEVPKWRFLVDRELDNVEAPRPDRPAQPVDQRVRIIRKGIWWLGWKESVKATIAATPVTDPRNAGVTGNAIQIKASRWRIFPLPWFLMVPILFMLMILLGSAPSNVRVTNALLGDDNEAYILGDGQKDVAFDVPMPVEIAYEAPGYAMVGATKMIGQNTVPVGGGGHNTVKDSVTVPQRSYGNEQDTTYSVRSKFFGGGESVRVHFVPWRTKGIFAINDTNGRPLPFKTEDFTFAGRTIPSRVYEVEVPTSGMRGLQIRNLTATSSTSSLQVYSVRMPGGFEIANMRNPRNVALNNGGTEFPKIAVSGGGETPEESIWLLATTDADCPVVQIKLRPAGTVSGSTEIPPTPTPTVNPTPTNQPTPTPNATPTPVDITSKDKVKGAQVAIRKAILDAMRAKFAPGQQNVFAPKRILVAGDWAVIVTEVISTHQTVSALLHNQGGWQIVESGEGDQVAGFLGKHSEARGLH